MSEATAQVKHRKYTFRLLLILFLLFIAVTSVFTNADLESTNVTIENLSVYVFDASTVIYWDTNILSDSLIKYGIDSNNLSNVNYLGVHSYAHAGELTELLPNSTYYFVVNSTNANGNSNETNISYFTTHEDLISPKFSNVFVSPINAVFKENQTYVFSVVLKDNGIISDVVIENNFNANNVMYYSNSSINLSYLNSSNNSNNSTSLNSSNNYTLSNSTMINIAGTDRYEYSVISLPAGNYSWRIIAKDTAGNSNSTEYYEYVVNKSVPDLNMYYELQQNDAEQNLTNLNFTNQNITIKQKSYLNILGILSEGDSGIKLVVRNSTALLNESYGDVSVSINQFFDSPGIYNVILIYDETLNYYSRIVSFIVNVTPIEVNLFTDKQEYNLGETVSYVVFAPNSSILTTEVCGPIPIGAGFVECKNIVLLQQTNYPYLDVQKFTNKSGVYRMRSQIQYKGLNKLSEKNYTVVNDINLTISGNTLLKVGEESQLLVSAVGGVGSIKFNWTLSNGTKISGQNLNVKYNSAGSYPVIITAIDELGNYKMSTITLIVKKHYTLKFVVVENATGEVIESAKVRMNDSSDTTDIDGVAEFDLIEGAYLTKVSASGYKSVSSTINSDSNKTITIRIDILPVNTNSLFDIELVYPVDSSVMTSASVDFEANINLNSGSQATCWFYVADDGSDWYRVMKTVPVQNSGTIKYSESFATGKIYSWKVQCDFNSKTYSSKVWKFKSVGEENQNDATLSIIDGENSVVDAGETRRRIESALSNLDALDVESKKDAEALEFATKIDKALKDYDRAMRDINNIGYRRDLSDAEQKVKIAEYQNIIRDIEKITPYNMKDLGYLTFISYPSKEDLTNLSKNYQQSKNLIGKVDTDALFKLQNNLITTTRISNVEITYLDGNKETLTLVKKTLKLTDNSTDTFILEYVPKEFAQSADDLTLYSAPKIINNDPLLKYDKGNSIVYYVSGSKDLEIGKKTKTILLSDSQFSAKNSLTGDVTFSSIEWTSPTSLIILIIIISCMYLFYAFDIGGKVFSSSKIKYDKDKENKIRSLIFDAKDCLKKLEIDRADLIFKEIRLIYEDVSDAVKEVVYEEALSLLDMIDVAQIELLLSSVENKSGNRENLMNSTETLRVARNVMSDSIKQKYDERIRTVITNFESEKNKGDSY